MASEIPIREHPLIKTAMRVEKALAELGPDPHTQEHTKIPKVCRTCKYWGCDAEEFHGKRVCHRIGEARCLTASIDDPYCVLESTKDFGCNEWRKNDG